MIQTFRNSLKVFASHFVHPLMCESSFLRRKVVKKRMTDKLNCNVQSCFRTLRAQKCLCVPFFGSPSSNNCSRTRQNTNPPGRLSFSFYIIVFLGFSMVSAPVGVDAGFGDFIKDWVIDFAKDMGLTVYPYTHYCGLQSEDENRPPESRIDKCCFYHDQCTVYAILSETKRYVRHDIGPA